MSSALLLIGFSILFFRFIYWIAFSFKNAKTYTMSVFVSQAAQGFLLLFFFVQFFGGVEIISFPKTIEIQFLGFCLIVGGNMLAFFAKKQLGDEWIYASSYTKQKGKLLITTGVYKYIRNPLYAGIIFSFIGAELLSGSWLFISAIFFFIAAYLQAKREEKFLLQIFGRRYEDYVEKTKMFVPGLV